MSSDNDVIIEAWNTVLFEKFSRFKHLLVDGLSGHSDAFFEQVSYPPTAQLLDIGCGFGDTAVHQALRLPQGHVTGVDCAENFVTEGRKLATERGAQNAKFLVADVQLEPLGGPYDYAFGRFGTMFFNMPGAAMRNIHKHLKPGGRLDMIVWRKREDNPWLHEAELIVKGIVPVISHEDSNQVHCGPGPFSMAGPDMVSSMLIAAGYEKVSFERCDTDICIGHDLADAVDFAMTLGPAGEIIRLAEDDGERLRPQVIEALRQGLRKYEREDGTIWAPSSTWFISATRPE